MNGPITYVADDGRVYEVTGIQVKTEPHDFIPRWGLSFTGERTLFVTSPEFVRAAQAVVDAAEKVTL